MKQDSKVVVIVGMHRSGTSVFSNWLFDCGLKMGDRLLGANNTNPHGHYEDLDFLEFHQNILRRNGLDYDVFAGQSIETNEYDLARAESMVMFKNKLYEQWAWKEPRTCLFLSLWKKLLPEAYYIVLHRNSFEVMDSLVRRDYKLRVKKRRLLKFFYAKWKFSIKKYRLQNHYLKVINNYNEHIIREMNDIPLDRKVFLNINDLKKNHKSIYQHLVGQWGLKLQLVDAGSVVNDNLFKAVTKIPEGLESHEVQSSLQLDEQFNKLILLNG